MTTPRGLTALPPLSAGAHKCVEQGACVMEAVAYVAGEPWTDRPACACPVLGAFMRAWNDDLPEADRDRLLRPLVRRLVGSRSTPEVEVRRSWLAMDWLVRTNAPAWLQLVPALVPHAAALTDLPPIVDAQTAAAHQSTFNAAGDAAWAAAEAAARVAAGDAAEAAARVTAGDAARAAAGDAAGAAAVNAARVAAGDAAEAAARVTAGDAARAAAGDAAWAAAVNAARAAAWDAAWDAARVTAGDAAWAAAVNAARAAMGDAARAALQPTVATLQLSALDLVDRMLAETASE